VTTASVPVEPLHKQDPRTLGDIQITGRLASTDTGTVYAGQLDGKPTAVVLLNEGAERDSYARARFEEAQSALTARNRTALLGRDTDVDIAPWVAVPAETWEQGLDAAGALLASVALEDVTPVGRPQGPPFRPHWAPQRRVGRWRVWPLPWPTVLNSAGRWTYVAAFALVLALAAVALLIAVKIFQSQAPAPPSPQPGPVPLPTPISPSPTHRSTPSPSHSPPPTAPHGTGPPAPQGVPSAPPIV
jgi:hypothetical protein